MSFPDVCIQIVQKSEAFRSVVLLPWDLNLVMFHDLYAMALPMFLPDRDGLHHTAFAQLGWLGNTHHLSWSVGNGFHLRDEPWNPV